ncbi:DNA cytosine methyltransferase [Stenotrophomonas sp. UBA7606]|uniref:DNA cytosine methyltransferase n=1 Tax=Stenotrophomonas sp. UBA7606 TaxID=1947559 RepID=UPI0026011CB6|nr:DNA cytosine methyltransferase [Stenotrophomonas sp. UBA7606]
MDYYNEFDPAVAAQLRALIKVGLIPAGEVDERSIEDVKPRDLRGYRQCHFFAGIGGWAHALALAGWPDDRPVWTGSCPCQPFSAAGKGAGFDDQRHLWPAFFHLIRECRPAAVFGEQVAGTAAGPWLDLVHADMEGMDYAFGCVPFAAAGVGAPHIRDRIYWFGSDTRSFRGPRQVPARSVGQGGQGGADWTLDLREILDSPFAPGRSHPQPLLRRMDDGFPSAVVGVHAFGNAIVPQAAAEFVIAAEMAIEDMRQMRFQEAA